MKSNCRKFFSANGELAFEEKSLQTQLLKNWLHEAAINFGIGNLQNLSLPVLVMLFYYITIKIVLTSLIRLYCGNTGQKFSDFYVKLCKSFTQLWLT